MTAMHAAASYVFLDDAGARLLEVAPRSLLEGEARPELWNLVRRAVDFAVEPGRFILTGPSVPPDDVTRHTGPDGSCGCVSGPCRGGRSSTHQRAQ